MVSREYIDNKVQEVCELLGAKVKLDIVRAGGGKVYKLVNEGHRELTSKRRSPEDFSDFLDDLIEVLKEGAKTKAKEAA